MLIERWPTHAELETFARSCRHGWPTTFADRVLDALTQPRLNVRPELARAKAGSIRLAAAQLLLLRSQRRAWERRMGELLLGGRRPRPGTPPKETPGEGVPRR